MMPELPGSSLRQLLHRKEANRQAFVAAARELRRVHRIPCEYYQAAWSHGDLHLDNILYDSETDRAVLIDFDTRHHSWLGETHRHGDDLKVALLELVASPDDQWLEMATALIEEYREPTVLNELLRQLFIPHGFARILWHTRTNGAPIGEVELRIRTLRDIIERTAGETAKYSPAQLCRDAR
jgi:hypothetical protein